MIFRKGGGGPGGGSKAVWNFSENSSDLVAGPFPYARRRANLHFPARLKPQKRHFLATTFLAPAPTGVVSLVPVSNDKIQITALLMLGRGALSFRFSKSRNRPQPQTFTIIIAKDISIKGKSHPRGLNQSN